MCVSFEKISGKKCMGNVGELKGLTKTYRDNNYKVAIISVPVELLDIDNRYQIEVRTERDLNYLVRNWDERKLLPLIGVPHWETGNIMIVDGYGRWISSQLVNKDKYKDLEVQVILNAPTEENERLAFEAELYAYQNKQVAKMTPLQKHGALMILNDPATKKLAAICKKYNLEYLKRTETSSNNRIGSYKETLNLCKIDNGKCADFVFAILHKAGFGFKKYGYSTYMMRSLGELYRVYPEDKKEIASFLAKYLRPIEPSALKAESVSKYPFSDYRSAVSLYLEDKIVESLDLPHKRTLRNNKVINIAM